MTKKSRLKEKPVRIPDISQEHISQKVDRYLREVKGLSTESARSHRFSILLNELFQEVNGNFIEDYLGGVEKYIKVKKKDIIIRGRVDALYGNLVIEFENDLNTRLQEAENQLKRYMFCLWNTEGEKEVNYLCMATDGINFQVFSSSADEPLKKPDDVTLRTVEKISLQDFEELYRAYYWLDRYFLRKRILPPTTEEFEKDFGLRGPAFYFSFNSLNRIWQEANKTSDINVLYDNWNKYLRITYGSVIGSEALFLRHTYLATLAKLMVWMRLKKATFPPPDEDILSIISGEFFSKEGLFNFLEEDFFSWIARGPAKDVGLDLSKKLINQLSNYNLNELSEDILKGLYQELVDPETRHDLGEYYTPDWLARKMVEKALADNPKASVLDPACGSGTFLYMTIKYKRETLKDSKKTLDHILKTTSGVEIHPLAVIIARTTYLLALGELLKIRRGPIQIPVYLADSIKLPEIELLKEYELLLDGKHLLVPEILIKDPHIYDEAIETSREFAKSFSGKHADESAFLNLLKRRSPQIASNPQLTQATFPIAKTMKELIEAGRDTIWAFILKNIFKPLFLGKKFDVVMGNPPWLSYRYVEKGEYQEFLKRNITRDYRLLSGKAELITHMELATLFFLRTAELYLKEGGLIAFVLPRSVFTADQHDVFRRSIFPFPLALEEVWDLEGVKPLFNVPACVFFAKRGGEKEYPLNCKVVSGELGRKNASLVEAEKALKVSEGKLFCVQIGKRSFLGETLEERTKGPSYYKPYFKSAACIYPRGLWFVDIRSHPSLGFNPERPYVETAQAVEKTAKGAYKGAKLQGNIEREFLYATLLSTDIVPFGHLDFRMVVLPILPLERNYKLLRAEAARKEGYLGLASWLDKAQKEWTKRRRDKAERADVLEWLDYRKKLTGQDRLAKYKVLYPTSATYLCGSVVERKPITLGVEGQMVPLQGFLADIKSFYYETNEKLEAYYLAAMLNSTIIDKLVKPLQSRGQWGPRDIHKKLWELPIPKFDPKNKDHIALAELGEKCTKKVKGFLPSIKGRYRGIGRIRRIVKEELEEELKEIDGITKRILGI